jgi:hypothetical protein
MIVIGLNQHWLLLITDEQLQDPKKQGRVVTRHFEISLTISCSGDMSLKEKSTGALAAKTIVILIVIVTSRSSNKHIRFEVAGTAVPNASPTRDDHP